MTLLRTYILSKDVNDYLYKNTIINKKYDRINIYSVDMEETMKLLASDFDNTIFVKDKIVLEKNINSIRKFVNLGNIFCIITGRNYSYLKNDLVKNNIAYSYLICEDGAQIFNNVDYCISTILMSKSNIDKIIEILEANNCKYYLEDGYNETTNKNDCVKVVGYDYSSRENAKRIIDELNKLDICYAYLSTEHINITDKRANKYEGLKKLIELEELDIHNLYTIGDSENDYEMLKKSNGVLMREHSKELDGLHLKEYNYLYEYIDELINN